MSQFQLDNSIVKEIPAPRAHVKLPEISIKIFSGDPLEWFTFWDSSSAAVDRDTEMSGIQKMNYLKGYLKGEAARAVSGLPLTDENYQKAVELLKDIFGRNGPSSFKYELVWKKKGRRTRLYGRRTEAIVSETSRKLET